MKKTLLLLSVFFCALALYSQDPVVKFYLNDESQAKEYKIEDITEINILKTNFSYSMEFFLNGSIKIFNTKDIKSIELVDSTKLKINLSSSSENISIAEIVNIIFVPNTSSELVIGTQVWMSRNLDVAHYRNGDEIPQVTDSSEWANLTTGAWCYYNNDPENGKIYGKLYNWYAVNDPRGLAPEGWHIPSYTEWDLLSSYVGGQSVAGGKLKSTGTIGTADGLWDPPNKGATNESAFTALPGGSRTNDYPVFFKLGHKGEWWSSTEQKSDIAWSRSLYSHSSNFYLDIWSYKRFGLSVRCVKD